MTVAGLFKTVSQPLARHMSPRAATGSGVLGVHYAFRQART